MNFEELAQALDRAYTECYESGREEGLEEFGRMHGADIESAIKGGRTLEEMVEQAKIGPASYWAEKVARGMDARDRLNILERRIKSLEEHMDKLERMIANLATKDDLKGTEDRLVKRIDDAEGRLVEEITLTRKMVRGEANPPTVIPSTS